MNKGIENGIRRKIIIFTVAAVAVIILVSFFMVTGVSQEFDHLYELETGWTVSINGTTYEDTDLTDFSFDVLGKGDVLEMTNTLPEDDVLTPVILLKTVLSVAKVYVDDELIYAYGEERAKNNQMLGYGAHLIEVAEGSSGKPIKITYEVQEAKAFNYLDTPIYGDSISVYRNFTADSRLALIVNSFLIIFGSLLLIVAVFSAIREAEYMRIMWVALFSVSIGTWSLCNYNLLLLFTTNLLVKTYAEYWSLYLSVWFVMAYFNSDVYEIGNKKLTMAYGVAIVLDTLFLILTAILTASNVLHLPDVLRCSHLLMLMGFLVMVVIVRKKYLMSGKKNPSIIVGMALLGLTGIVDVIHFNVQKYLDFVIINHYNSFVCVGVLIFIISMLLDFGFGIGKRLEEAAKSEVLEKIAYTDVLTGLFNRRKADEVMHELVDDTNYGILNFDLNHLKQMNDNYGHEQGDLLIKTFSDILIKVFSEYGIVCRMGGDEFAVIFTDVNSIDINKLISDMDAEIKKVNDEHQLMVEVSAAYGFCRGDEEEVLNSEDAYRIADGRMYQNKLESKAARK